MKKSKSFRPAHIFLLLSACLGIANAAPFGPEGRLTQWTQATGEVVEVRIYGDEYYARTETLGGHTLVSEDGTYFYATLSADGKALVSTGVPAHEAAPPTLVPHIDIPKEEILRIAMSRVTPLDIARSKRWQERVIGRLGGPGKINGRAAPPLAGIEAAPVSGNRRGLTILVEFPNDPSTPGGDPVPFPTDRNKIVRFCNGVGYNEDGNTGSVRDYFSDQSLGMLTYTQDVTPIVTLPRARNFYNYADYPTNRVLQQPQIGATAMVQDAVAILKSQNFDFTGLTVDAGGLAVATNIFFAGPDSGMFAQGLWPHSFNFTSLVSVGTTANPITLSAYQITNIPTAAPTIGTFCHENGHLLLDYPDIYAVGTNGEGVGEHCLMGSGNFLNDGKTPPPLNAYFKDLSGWGRITSVAPTDFVSASLPTTGNVAYKITNPNNPNEFFMVENRGDGDKWAQFADDKGIAIWHIDATIDGNVRIPQGGRYGISLEQADGRMDLENGRNRGDGGDLFDLIDPSFTDRTNPNANWWDGTRSLVEVEVTSQIGRRTDVTLGGVPANTIIVGSPNGGEIIYRNSIYPIVWRANIFGNVRIDLLRGGAFHSNITLDAQNTGTFDWEVPSDLASARNYSLRITSLGNPVPATDLSDANFSVTNATFPANNKFPQGWFKPGFAKTRFDVTSSQKFEGRTSLASSVNAGDGQVSGIGYRSHFKAGTVSFYIKVSSEKGFDVAKFYIDGQAQSFPGVASANGISGNQDWVLVQYPVSAGRHTFVWSYEKDDSFAGLQDTAWIDGVTLPQGSQKIAVQEPVGKNLQNNQSKVTFPNTVKGTSSKPLVFTIKNRGRAALTDFSIKVIGDNSTEFSVRGPANKSLKKGQTTTFEVTFNPKDFGKRLATIRIDSNDENTPKFKVKVEGKGLGSPELGVNQPVSKSLDDGDSRNFGIAKVGTKGKTKTFTVINNGSAILKNLRVKTEGPNKRDFKVGALGVIVLDPGDSTTFKVTFTPRGTDSREAILRILSTAQGNFQIKVGGKGAPGGGRGGAKSALARSGLAEAVLGKGLANSAAGQLQTSTGVDVVDGGKYLSLSVTKPADGTPAGTVEVSSNLLDWYSGGKHTTIIIDDAETLKVRDNTPVAPGEKRYIRLK